jgi:hypothetical protein
MPTNLTGSTIASTFDQLLHVDDGPTATEKTVYSGTGVATALKVGTTSASVGNVQLTGNTISTLNANGNLVLAPNGTGSVAIGRAAITGGTISGITDLAVADGGTGASTAGDARTNLGLGTIATQNANNVALTGGTISGVTFTGSFSGLTLVESTTLATSNATAGLSLTNNDLLADGTDTDIDINITPKGTGEVNVTNIDILSGKVPFNTITNLAYASFFDADTADQTGSVTAATAVEWATAAVTGAGITIASDSRITLAAAGTYRINASLQFNNSTNTVRTVLLWFAINGTNIADSAAKVTVPKNSEGGTDLTAYEIFVTVTAGQYVEMYWYPSDTSATLHYIAPVTANPGVTPAIPAVPPAIVVVERIA